MPELPEVETVKKYLDYEIKDDIFTSVEIYNKKLRVDIPSDLGQIVKNQKITKISRRAKYILINLSVSNRSLLIHLGMTGKFLIYRGKYHPTKHDHIVFSLSSGRKLIFNDQRRFGLITYINNDLEVKQNCRFLGHLGIEPLSIEFNGKYLKDLSKNSRLEIKKFIMEQKNVVGVGNIYAAEALFLSKINPTKIVQEISLKQYDILASNIKLVLANAIAKGGSTIKDFTSINGNSGYFQNELNVYGRENEPCKICNSKIIRIVQGGRSTFYCKKCQKG